MDIIHHHKIDHILYRRRLIIVSFVAALIVFYTSSTSLSLKLSHNDAKQEQYSVMNSAYKGRVPNEAMDLEAGLPLILVGDSSGQTSHNPFQEVLPENLPIDQKRLLLVWLIVASVMSAMLFDSVILNANNEAMLFFITAGNFVLLLVVVYCDVQCSCAS